MFFSPAGALEASRWKPVYRTPKCAAAMRNLRNSLWQLPCESEENSKAEHGAVFQVATGRSVFCDPTYSVYQLRPSRAMMLQTALLLSP